MLINLKLIVPVYNVELYLQDCLQSIQQQTYTDFTCLVVDDGSTDNSTDIAQTFCHQDSRFQYCNKPNGGVADARNFGINLCGADDYIIPIDSDDLIQPQLLEFVFQTLKTNDVDLIIYDFQRIKHNTSLTNFSSKLTYECKIISKTEAIRQQNFSWARVCKKSHYSDNLFPTELPIYEDLAVIPLLTAKSTNIIMISVPLYGYRRRTGSFTMESAAKQFIIFDALDVLKNRCSLQNIDINYYITAKITILQSCILSAIRLNTFSNCWDKLKQTQAHYQDISLSEGIFSLADTTKKILFTIIKLGFIGRLCCSLLLRPLLK